MAPLPEREVLRPAQDSAAPYNSLVDLETAAKDRPAPSDRLANFRYQFIPPVADFLKPFQGQFILWRAFRPPFRHIEQYGDKVQPVLGQLVDFFASVLWMRFLDQEAFRLQLDEPVRQNIPRDAFIGIEELSERPFPEIDNVPDYQERPRVSEGFKREVDWTVRALCYRVFHLILDKYTPQHYTYVSCK